MEAGSDKLVGASMPNWEVFTMKKGSFSFLINTFFLNQQLNRCLHSILITSKADFEPLSFNGKYFL